MVQHGRADGLDRVPAGTLRHRTLSLQRDGTDTVKVGSDETPVRVLDKKSPPTRRAGITATGSTAKGNSPVATVSRRGLFPGENHSLKAAKQ